ETSQKQIYIMRYLRHTIEYGLVFKRAAFSEIEKGNLINAFCDSSFATEEGSKSRYGYFFFVMGGLVSWTSSNSSRIMTSSTEAECHALVHASKENLWIREFLTEFALYPKIQPSKSSIALSVGGPSHRRSKRFGIEFDYYRERIELGDLQLLYRETSQL